MPELPEVEVTTRKLKPLILGKRILPAGRQVLGGRKILGVERKGKAILIHLSGDKILGFHQRMTGKLLVVPRGFKDKHIRHRFRLSDGKDLVFHDVRKFGVVWYGTYKKVFGDKYFRSLGSDALSISLQEFKNLLKGIKSNPLNPPYSKGDIKRKPSPYEGEGLGEVKRRRGAIKSFLLNQKNLAGVGNIMADEILWHAKIHPETAVSDLRDDKIKILWRSLRSVLKKSIRLGGSTMRDWLHPDGVRGGYFKKRFVYGREGEKCFRCARLPDGQGAKIIRKKIAGRSSYYCNRCQYKHLSG